MPQAKRRVKRASAALTRKGASKVTPAKIARTIRSKAGSTIFHVQFVKRTNGELRDMNCRLGVAKDIKGNGLPYSPIKHGLMVVYDTDKRAYRMLSLMDITYCKIRGTVYPGPRKDK